MENPVFLSPRIEVPLVMKDKILLLLIAVLLTIPALGCGHPAETSTPEPPTTPSPTTTPPATLEPNPPYEVLVDGGFAEPEIPRLTSENLKQIMDGGGDVIIIDNRYIKNFKEGHLPGAINIPHSLLNADTAESIDAQLKCQYGTKADRQRR